MLRCPCSLHVKPPLFTLCSHTPAHFMLRHPFSHHTQTPLLTSCSDTPLLTPCSDTPLLTPCSDTPVHLMLTHPSLPHVQTPLFTSCSDTPANFILRHLCSLMLRHPCSFHAQTPLLTSRSDNPAHLTLRNLCSPHAQTTQVRSSHSYTPLLNPLWTLTIMFNVTKPGRKINCSNFSMPACKSLNNEAVTNYWYFRQTDLLRWIKVLLIRFPKTNS